MSDRTIKNAFEYAIFLCFVGLSKLLPRRTALALGGLLGRTCRYLFRKKSRIAYDNISRAFPEMPPQEVRRNVAATFRHLGVSAMEMLTLDRFRSDADLKEYFTFEGLEHLHTAYEQGRGVFLLTGHVGFWEVGTFFLPKLGFAADWVAKKMKNPHVDRYFLRMREAGGGRCLDSKHGARRIVRSLAAKRGVAVLLDQHISRSQAVEVDFFGRPACTTPIIAQIAMKQGVPIVPVFVYRTRDYRYRVVVEPPVALDAGSGQEALLHNTQRLTDIIEAAVRRDITQWFWVHRRWRA